MCPFPAKHNVKLQYKNNMYRHMDRSHYNYALPCILCVLGSNCCHAYISCLFSRTFQFCIISQLDCTFSFPVKIPNTKNLFYCCPNCHLLFIALCQLNKMCSHHRMHPPSLLQFLVVLRCSS